MLSNTSLDFNSDIGITENRYNSMIDNIENKKENL